MTERVDYDRIAAQYESRYERNDYTGFERALTAFVGNANRVLEVGCGTGHWLRFFSQPPMRVVGIDPSARMLAVARERLADAPVIRAGAEALPFRTASFDRLFCVNALHHFSDPAAFFSEARRVLTDGGALITIGLDPRTGRDRWWIYDYFPSALARDRQRYLATDRIRDLMAAAGFTRCETREVQHSPWQMSIAEAARRGFLARTSTSQLMVISDAEYAAGMERLSCDQRTQPEKVLRADLRVYSTTGWAD